MTVLNMLSGSRIGRALRQSLGYPDKVDVIFCPGMGNGCRHQDQAYALWQNFRVWFSNWHTFAAGGQDFTKYIISPLHPGGMPQVDAEQLHALKRMVSDRAADDKPVVLFGFSAGANLVLTAARELEEDGCAAKFAVIALGHTVFPANRMRQCNVPGIIILGSEELKLGPSLRPLKGRYTELADLSRIPGGALPDDVGVFDSWGSFAGCESEPYHIARCFQKCVVLEAMGSAHSVWQYERALLRGQLRHVSGPSLPSTRTCSIASSASAKSSQGRAQEI